MRKGASLLNQRLDELGKSPGERLSWDDVLYLVTRRDDHHADHS